MAQDILLRPINYQPVGSFLPNEINYSFGSDDQNYITTILKKTNGDTIATLKQSIFNNSAKIDVSKVLKSLLNPKFNFNTLEAITEDATKYIEYYVDSDTASKRTAILGSTDKIEGNLIDYVCRTQLLKGKFSTLLSEIKCSQKGAFISCYLENNLLYSFYLRKRNYKNGVLIETTLEIIDMKIVKNFYAYFFLLPFLFSCDFSEIEVCRKIQYLNDFSFSKPNNISGWTQLDNFIEETEGIEFSNLDSKLTAQGEPGGSISKIVRQFIQNTKITIGTYTVNIKYRIIGTGGQTNWTFHINGDSYILDKNKTDISFDIEITGFSLGLYAFDWYIISGVPSGFGLQNTIDFEYISLTNNSVECISETKKTTYQKKINEFYLSFINRVGGIDTISNDYINKVFEKKESQKISEITKEGFRQFETIKRLSNKLINLSITSNRKDKKILDSNLTLSQYVCLSILGSDFKKVTILNNDLGQTNNQDNFYESELSIQVNSDFFI